MRSLAHTRIGVLGVVLIAALAAWIGLALVSANIAHPDELNNYLEKAHLIAFGYGYESWDYRVQIRPPFVGAALAPVLKTMDMIGLG